MKPSHAPNRSTARSARADLRTPDGRYLIVRGRLWRTSDPHLEASSHKDLVLALMAARRDVAAAKRAGDAVAEVSAHAAVDRAKHSLGERGRVWWTDGSPDYNRHLVHTTPYAEWYASFQELPDRISR